MRRAVLGMLLGLLAGCQTGPARSVVFFSPWSIELDVPAEHVVQDVAQRAQQQPWAVVTVYGYASPLGSARDNEKVAAGRAQAVADALVKDGVDPKRILRVAEGSVDYTLDTVESRRVVITLTEPQQR